MELSRRRLGSWATCFGTKTSGSLVGGEAHPMQEV